MATPEELQAIWSQAISQFPQLADRWGTPLPEDRKQLNDALGEYKVYLTSQQVKEPDYLTPGYWGDIGKRLGTGALSLIDPRTYGAPIPGETFQEKALREAQEALPEGQKLSKTEEFIAESQPTLGAFQAFADIIAPISGALLKGDPAIQERMKVLEQRTRTDPEEGGAPGWLGDIERYAAAYQDAVASGDLPMHKQVLAEAIPEMGIGGIASALKGPPMTKALSSLAPMAPGSMPTKTFGELDPTTGVAGRQYNVPISRAEADLAEVQARQAAERRAREAAEFVPPQPPPPPPPTDVGAIQRALPMEQANWGVTPMPPEARLGWQSGLPSPESIRAVTPEEMAGQAQMFPGPRIPDMPAEELLRRQADQPTWGWGPGQTVGRQVTPGGRARSWKTPDITRAEAKAAPEVFEPRLPLGEDIQNLSPLSDRIPESVKPTIDKLLSYRQRGVDINNPGFKRWQSQWTDEVARAVFGDTSLASRNKVTEFIDTLPGQQTLPFDDFGSMQMKFQLDESGAVPNIWTRWLEDFYELDTATNRYVPRPNRPLPPTKKGWLGRREEEELSNFIDRTAPKSGSIPNVAPVIDAGDQQLQQSLRIELRGVGLNPFMGRRTDGFIVERSSVHRQQEGQALRAGWREDDLSVENIELGQFYAARADDELILNKEMYDAAGVTSLEQIPQTRVPEAPRLSRKLTPEEISAPPPSRTPASKIIPETAVPETGAVPPVTPVKNIVPDQRTSGWIKNKATIEGNIFDDARKTWREYATPAELASLEGGPRAWLKGETKTAAHQTVLRNYEGTVRSHDLFMEDIIYEGTEEMKKLGWLNNKGEVTVEAIGSIDNPGPLRILYNALHDESYLPLVAEMGEDAIRQYHNLRALTDFEQNLRVGGGLKIKAFNPEEGTEQYFYRGVIPESGDFDEFNRNVIKYNNAARLGRTKSIEFQRIDKSWEELQRLGLRPMFWNPYTQAMYSSRLGLQVRMQAELLNLLKNDDLNMAQYVEKSTNGVKTPLYDDLIRQGWQPLEEAGPALRGDKLYGVPEKFSKTVEKTVDDKVMLVEYEYLFPKNVANSMNQMFAPKELAFVRTKRAVLGNLSIDDLIYIPKRADLFGSLFQQVDFAQRGIFTGFATSLESMLRTMVDLGQRNIDSGTAFKEVLQSFNHAYRFPQQWGNMARAFFSKSYRRELKKMLLDDSEWFEDESLRGFSNLKSVQRGLHVTDRTILDRDEGIKMLDDVVEELGWKQKMPRHAKQMVHDMEMWFREGLFEGVYPAAIYHDYRYNIVPMAIKANRGNTIVQNSDQIMGLAAKRANLNWSTIPIEQSVFKGTAREWLKRLLFSLNEQEAFGRQFTGMFRGESKMFFTTRNVGALFGMWAIGNLIHRSTTGEWLPKDRWMPFQFSGHFTTKFGYNPQYLQPDIPVPGRDGDRVTLDLLMQYDLVFRMLDGAYGLPVLGGINQRLGSTPRLIASQLTGEDFRGRDISQWGYLQRGLQGIYDLAAPIGLGQIGSALIIRNIGEKKLGAIGSSKFPILAEGATVADIMPTEESKLGALALGLQGVTGLNLKAETGKGLKDRMTFRLFGNGTYPDSRWEGKVYKSWDDVEKDKENSIELKNIILNDARNLREVNEMELRQREGYRDHYDGATKAAFDIRKENDTKLEKQAAIIERHATNSIWSDKAHGEGRKAWPISQVNAELKDITSDHRAALQAIEQTYSHDPIIKMALEERKEEPKRSDEPLVWAWWKWDQIRDSPEVTDPVTGKIDHNKFNELWDEETSQWDDEDMKETGGLEERFNAFLQEQPFTHKDHHPLIAKKYEAINELSESGYWQDGIKGPSDTFGTQLNSLNQLHSMALGAMGKTSSDVWDEYLKAYPEDRRSMESSESKYAVVAIIKTMKLVRKAHRYEVLLANPDLDRHVIFWFGNQPTHPQNREYYRELYGRYPAQTRKMPFR